MLGLFLHYNKETHRIPKEANSDKKVKITGTWRVTVLFILSLCGKLQLLLMAIAIKEQDDPKAYW